MDKLFDRYVWQARCLPAFIIVLPVALAFLAWVPKAQDAAKPLLAVLGATGIAVLLANVMRSAGKKAEVRLVAQWGGMPSVIMLRHADTAIDAVTKKRYHEVLARLVPGIKMPTQRKEVSDPDGSDSVYKACSSFLLAQMRDHPKATLLAAENRDYGYRRNLYGMRLIGTVFTIAGAVGCSAKLARNYHTHAPVSALALACLIICIVLVGAWAFAVTASWVRQGADAYALRLLEGIDILASETQVTPEPPANSAMIQPAIPEMKIAAAGEETRSVE